MSENSSKTPAERSENSTRFIPLVDSELTRHLIKNDLKFFGFLTQLALDADYKTGRVLVRGHTQYGYTKKEYLLLRKKFVKMGIGALERALGRTLQGTTYTLTNTEVYDLQNKNRGTRKGTRSVQKEDPPLYTQEEKNKKINKKVAEPSASALNIFDFFVDSLKSNLPEVRKLPRKDQAVHFDKILRTHGESEIISVISFSHQDNFWSSHILSPSKLKEKFNTLIVQSRKKHKVNGVDRRTKNLDGTPVESELDNLYS